MLTHLKTVAVYAADQERALQAPKEMAWGNFAIFVDPDGNEFGLSDG